jgi:hypothetical protein
MPVVNTDVTCKHMNVRFYWQQLPAMAVLTGVSAATAMLLNTQKPMPAVESGITCKHADLSRISSSRQQWQC